MQCCFINPETNEECTHKAEYEIWYKGLPYEPSQSCKDHLGYMIDDWLEIKPIPEDKPKTSVTGVTTKLNL